MIRLKSNQLKTGMVTAQSIFNEKGAAFLVRGTPLTDRYIYRLRQLSVPELHVTSLSSNFQLQPPPDIIKEHTRVQAVENVAETFRQAEMHGQFNMSLIERCADLLVRDIMSKKKNLVQITDIRLHDSYTFSHSVNVAVLSATSAATPRANCRSLRSAASCTTSASSPCPHSFSTSPAL